MTIFFRESPRLPCLWAFTMASSRARRMAKLHSWLKPKASACCSISSSTRRAAHKSLGITTWCGRGRGSTGIAGRDFDSRERFDPIFGAALDVEELIQPRNLEHLVDLGMDIGQHQATLPFAYLLVQRDEHAQGRAGKVFDVSEIQK